MDSFEFVRESRKVLVCSKVLDWVFVVVFGGVDEFVKVKVGDWVISWVRV